MNDLMTRSFVNYVELKKQAHKDILHEYSADLCRADEQNLFRFYDEVGLISADIDGLSALLAGLHALHQERISACSVKLLRGIGGRMNADMAAILRQAKVIKQKLESLDASNIANRSIFPEGGPVDRARVSVTLGLRNRLRETINKFHSVRERIVAEQEDQYHHHVKENMVENVVSESGLKLQEFGKADQEMEERAEVIGRVRKSLTDLQQVMLDMAVLVEAQGEHVNDIEKNVERAGYYISGGTGRLLSARVTKRKKGAEVVLVAALALFFFVMVLIWMQNE